MKIRIHNPIYGVPITFLDKWRPFEPVYILNPDRYANEYIISSVIKPFSYFYCLIPTQFRIVGLDRYVENNPRYGHRFTLNGKETYARICIQKI